MAEKKFIITESEKQQIWNWIVERRSLKVNRLLGSLPELEEEKRKGGKIEQELRLVYEFLKEEHPEIFENVSKYLLLNLKSEEK